MEAIELRIGNWVLKPNREGGYYESRIDSGSELDIASCFEPIPITEEWLLKFGLKKDDLGYLSIGEPINRISLREIRNINLMEAMLLIDETEASIEDVPLIGYKYKNFPHFKFVHQLQNLYFALTGQEL